MVELQNPCPSAAQTVVVVLYCIRPLLTCAVSNVFTDYLWQ